MLNNPLIYTVPDGRTLVDSDGNPVTYKRDEETGVVIWDDNASEDIRRIGNALLETETGTEQLDNMISSEVEISLKISDEEVYSEDTGAPLRGLCEYTDYTKNEDGTYTVNKADIIIYEGAIKAYMNKYSESQHVKIMNTEERMIAGTAGHEALHATDKENASRSIQQANGEKPYIEREDKPRAIERKIIKETYKLKYDGN